MDDAFGLITMILFWVLLTASEVYGLYLSILEGLLPFCIALVLPPWAIIKGFIGLLGLAL